MKIRLYRYVAAGCAGALLSASAIAEQSITYPGTRKIDHANIYTFIMFNISLTPVFPGAAKTTTTGF